MHVYGTGTYWLSFHVSQDDTNGKLASCVEQQRAAPSGRAERRRMEVERKRKEKQEERQRQREREEREERIRLELETEQQQRAEAFKYSSPRSFLSLKQTTAPSSGH